MSLHPSLSSGGKRKKHRSVLKRSERIEKLQKEDKWKEGHSVFGLPKIKIVRIKFKKAKVAEAEAVAVASPEAEGVAAGAEAATPSTEARTPDEKPGKDKRK